MKQHHRTPAACVVAWLDGLNGKRTAVTASPAAHPATRLA